ncbi:MAG: TonB-dependent receptor [Methylobacter sp.]|nr:TonB-dependent receptor [Methylobacter sp.]
MKNTNLLWASACLCAYVQTVSAEERLINFTIPPQAAATALDTLAKQADLQMLFSRDALKNSTTQGLSGKHTARDALKKLLTGTGLTYTFTAADAVAIKPAVEQLNKAGPTTLKPINVTATAIRNVTDPYNQDYVFPNPTSGTKTDTPIMETPLNVQVISKQVLKDQQVITLQDSLKNVSGVTVSSIGNSQPGDTIFNFRGFESTTFFRNGFRLEHGSKGMANVESVEVLKGPAAILYGLVEPGGMVNVITKQPLATPYYAFNQQFGSYDNYRTTVDATGPVASNKDVLYRMNISYQNSGSWQDYVGNEDLFLAPVLKWNLSPTTQVSAEFEYNRQHQGLADSFNPYVNGLLLNIPLSRNYGAYSPAVNESFFGNINWSHQFNDDWKLKHSFTVNQQSFKINNLTLAKFTIPSDTLELFGFQPPISGTNVMRQNSSSINQNNTYSTNLDLTGHFDTFGLKHTLLLGGDYYRLNYNSGQDIPAANQYSLVDVYNPVNPGFAFNDIGNNSNFKQQFDQYGLYAQDQIQLPYDLHVTGGLRYQNIHQKSKNTSSNGFIGPDGVLITSENTAVSQDAVTPRVGILWHPQSWISLYANYAESFGANTGLVWSASGQFKPVAPTSAEQYEGGIKTEFFDGRLRATLAYYDLTKSNVAAGDPDPTHVCGGGLCSLAIGAVRSRGPELDIQGEILPGWNAIATWANTDVIVTKSNAKNDAINTGTFSYAVGDRLLNVPRNTASFWNTYEFQDTVLKGLKFGGGVTIRQGQVGSGGSTLFGEHYPPITTPGYATLDLMTAYSHAVGKSKITVQLNINNLLDKRYYTSINAAINDPTFQAFSASAPYGAPRTVMGSINIQY